MSDEHPKSASPDGDLPPVELLSYETLVSAERLEQIHANAERHAAAAPLIRERLDAALPAEPLTMRYVDPDAQWPPEGARVHFVRHKDVEDARAAGRDTVPVVASGTFGKAEWIAPGGRRFPIGEVTADELSASAEAPPSKSLASVTFTASTAMTPESVAFVDEMVARCRAAEERENRRRLLEDIGIEPWRVPADGLIEYDETYDEWRVEVRAQPVGLRRMVGRRIIVRRRAGRRRPPFPRSGWVDFSPYLVDDDGRTRVWFGPSGADSRDAGQRASSAPFPTVEELKQAAAALMAQHEYRAPRWPVEEDPVPGRTYQPPARYMPDGLDAMAQAVAGVDLYSPTTAQPEPAASAPWARRVVDTARAAARDAMGVRREDLPLPTRTPGKTGVVYSTDKSGDTTR